MISLTFLGTGGAVAVPERDNTSYALARDEGITLIDCSGAVTQKLRRAGLDALRVDSLLVTHIHPDHIYGLPSLVHSLFLEEGLIRLFGSEEAIRVCRDLLDLFCLREPRIKMRVDFVPLRPGQRVVLDESLEVEAFSVPHHSSSLGYHFFLGQGSRELILSGDTAPTAEVFSRARDKDFLVHDCSTPLRYFEMYPVLRTMHTESTELGRLAQEAGVRCLVPVHFFGEVEFGLEEIAREIRENYRGRLVIPRDLDRLTLTGA